jgi:outer membrane protein OmpA-like peptidoglycan-associated protein
VNLVKDRHIIFSGVLFLIFTLFVSNYSLAQKNDMQKADRYFDLNMFHDAIPFYIEASKQGKKEEKERAMLQLANCYRITGEFELAEKTYQKILKNKKTPPLSYFNYGLALKASSKYLEAITVFEKYRTKAPVDSANANRMIKSCLLAQQWLDEPIQYNVKLVDNLSSESPDFAAGFYQDGVYFCSSREGSKKPLLNFNGGSPNPALDYYYTTIITPVDSIKPPIQFPGNLNTVEHEGPGSFNKEFNTLYFTKSVIGKKSKESKRLKTLQIYVSKKDSAGNWSLATSAFSFNSSKYSTGHPSITRDGKRIYFMSDMPGGIGGTDIYYCDLQKNGQWGKPVNLGRPINTIGNELFPFITSDSILYFSSNMHPGMGKLDIFYSKQKSDSLWEEPHNMRPPINTIGDDFAFVKDEKFNRGFLSSDRFNGKGFDDIYTFSLIEPFTIQVEGTDIVIADQTFFDGVTYKLVNDSTGAETLFTWDNGVYRASLDTNVSYTLAARKDGFRYAKVGLTRFKTEDKHNINFLIRPKDKTVKVAGTLYHLDSTQTNNVAKVESSFVTLFENDNPLSTQELDKNSSYNFDYELTDGNEYLLKDSEDDHHYELPKKVFVDTNVIVQNTTTDSLIFNDTLPRLKVDSLITQVSDSTFNQPTIQDSIVSIPIPEKVVFKGLCTNVGNKLSNVQIKLYFNDTVQATTKSNGIGMFLFVLDPHKPKYTIFASKPGYESREYSILTKDFYASDLPLFNIDMVEKERIDVKGTVRDKDSVLANAQLDIYSNIEAQKTQITDNDGKFQFTVNPDGDYSMMVNKKGYLPSKVDIDLQNLGEDGDLDLSIEMDTLKVDKVFRMNIYYEFDKSDIKPASEIELDRFISFMRINPTVTIEISAHTDEQGADQYNMNLSKERAKKVMHYLIFEGRVEKNRIVSNGYGETQPIIKNAKTEEEHQLNRRTEVRILGF